MKIIIITIAVFLIACPVFAAQKGKASGHIYTNDDLEERVIPSETDVQPPAKPVAETKVKYEADGRRIEISREILLPGKTDGPQKNSQAAVKSPEDPAVTIKNLEPLLKQKWQGMTAELLKGNIEKVLAYFAPENRAKYRTIFSRYNPNEINARFSGVYDLRLYEINGAVAECIALRREDSGTKSYPVRFVKPADGNWLIDGL